MNARRQYQHGFNLIELMVAMLLSILTVAAMLMTYRSMVAVSVPATRSAVRDGQATSALLAAQIELQQAGFGILPADAGVNLDVTGGNRIVWRYRATVGAANPILCAGLRLQATGAATDGIYYLNPVACNSAADALTFPTSRLLASAAVLFEPGDESRRYNLSTARFRLEPNQSCGPFGIAGPAPNRTRVVMEDTAPNPDVAIFTYCLTNT
jgi:prepilin-type N-terminal cleavage/methylation domain-containing protein